MGRMMSRTGADIIHAWGTEVAIPARAATDRPLIVELFDPTVDAQTIKKIRSIAEPHRFAAVCTSGTIRRRLIEGGVAPDLCVVIRPGVDFAEINRVRRSGIRAELGLRDDDFVVVLPEPVTTNSGDIDAFLAVLMVAQTDDRIRLLVPGDTREARRIRRLARVSPIHQDMMVEARDRPFESLVPMADAMVVSPRSDIATTALAWAMAAKVTIIGSAVYAVAELITNKVNGFLFTAKPGSRIAPTIARLLVDREAHAKPTEAARGQAYEVFSVRRYIDLHARLYENMLAGRPPGTEIVDPALPP